MCLFGRVEIGALAFQTGEGRSAGADLAVLVDKNGMLPLAPEDRRTTWISFWSLRPPPKERNGRK
jgi:hypothetical protein